MNVRLPSDSIGQSLARLFSQYDQPGRPGVALLVLKDGETLLERTSGLANVQSGEPVTSATNFRLASVSKQFTAVAILILVDSGDLNLDGSVVDYLPELGPAAAAVTLQNLLQHSSGLPDYEKLIEPCATRQVRDWDVVSLVSNHGLRFTPGTRFRYSNTGYALLACIAERVAGIPYPELLREKIFKPLGMSGSVAFVEGVNEIPNRALGCTVDGGRVVETDQSPTSAVLGDGGVYSSLNDLRRWDEGLRAGKVLRRDLLEQAWTSGRLMDGQETNYGLGWEVHDYRGFKCASHSGCTSGFRNFIACIPERGFTVIALSNRSNPLPPMALDLLSNLYLFEESPPATASETGAWITGFFDLDAKEIPPQGA